MLELGEIRRASEIGYASTTNTGRQYVNPEPSRNDVCIMKPKELAYLAGFIDGEGAFIINRRMHKANGRSYEGYSAYIDIGNTDEKVMRWIKDIVGVTSNVYKQKQPNNRRDVFRLRIGGKQSVGLATEILPFLRVKKAFAEKFITYPLQHRRKDRAIAIQLFKDFREMNSKNGKSHPRFCVCRDLTGDTLRSTEGEEKVHSLEKSGGRSA